MEVPEISPEDYPEEYVKLVEVFQSASDECTHLQLGYQIIPYNLTATTYFLKRALRNPSDSTLYLLNRVLRQIDILDRKAREETIVSHTEERAGCFLPVITHKHRAGDEAIRATREICTALTNCAVIDYPPSRQPRTS